MFRRVWTVAFDATNHFLAEDGWAIASHIALSALMSLFPFLIFVTALAGFFGSQDLADEVARLIFSAWPAAVAGPIAAEVRDVLTAPRGGLLTFGAALALYFSSNAIEALRVGLDRAYAFPETRPWWLLRLQSLGFMIVGAAALLGLALLVVLGPLIWATAVEAIPALAPMQWTVTFLRLGVATLLLAVTMLIAHRWLPAQRLRLIDIAPGVIASFVTSIAFGEIFGVYLSQFARNYVSTYAGLASVMIALAFLYTLAAIFVFGGALNAAIMRAREGRRLSRATPAP
jgi:membrane protein